MTAAYELVVQQRDYRAAKKLCKPDSLIFRLISGEPDVLLDFIFRPAVLPHVMLIDLVTTKVKQLRTAFNNILASLGVGVPAIPGPGDAVAMVTAVDLVDLEIFGVFEPTSWPVA